MSATPTVQAGLPLLGRIGDAGKSQVRRVWGETVRRLLADFRSIPRYVARYSVVVFALFGVLSLLDALGDGPMPVAFPLMGTAKDPNRVSAASCARAGASDDDRWRGLASALGILDDVNPVVAAWVRKKHEDGSLVFSNQYCADRCRQIPALARYDHFHRTLLVQRALFDEKDGEIAAVLCHEYRHSRQNPAKLLRCALSFAIMSEGDPSILENDAIVYEQEARAAIFRR
jgi:hypothetical protein